MMITPAGERVLAAATVVLQELDRAEHDVSQQVIARDGIVRVSTECYTCYHWLPAHIQTFGSEWPRVEVRIVVEATHQPLQALLDDRIDVGIVSTPWKNAKLRYASLFKDDLVVIVNPQHPLVCRSFVAAEDFKDEHLIAYNVPREQLTIFQNVLTPAGISPRSVSHVQLTEAIVEMVKAGLGIAVLARWAVAPHVQAATIVALPLTQRGFKRQWYAATIRRHTQPDYLKAFLRQLQNDRFFNFTRIRAAKA
jgi:LysR family transcriptional regulator for metE and metH